MKRPANAEGTLRRIEAWRAARPDLVIRSTFIVGFPGETEREFEELLAFLDAAQLDRVGCFAYSPVDGAAANALPDPVPEDVKEERRARFMAVQATISAARLARRVGADDDRARRRARRRRRRSRASRPMRRRSTAPFASRTAQSLAVGLVRARDGSPARPSTISTPSSPRSARGPALRRAPSSSGRARDPFSTSRTGAAARLPNAGTTLRLAQIARAPAQVGAQVVDVLDADRQPHQRVADAERRARLGRDRRVRHDRRVLDQALDAAQALGEREDLAPPRGSAACRRGRSSGRARSCRRSRASAASPARAADATASPG